MKRKYPKGILDLDEDTEIKRMAAEIMHQHKIMWESEKRQMRPFVYMIRNYTVAEAKCIERIY